MFSSRALAPMRRASQLVVRNSTTARPFQPPVPQLLLGNVNGASSLSMLRPTPSKPSTQPRQRFNKQQIPPLWWWQSCVSSQGPSDLTGEDLFNAAMRYCELATDKSSSWQAKLEKDYNIDNYTLHYAGLTLLNRPGDSGGALGFHMLLTASNLGYTPSTLSAKRLKLTSSKRETDYPPSRRLDARFKQLLQIGSDPDVLTLQGFDWLRQGNDGFALRYFDRAIAAAAVTISSVGTPQPAKDQAQSGQQNDNPAVREPRWFYEALCHQNRGLLLLQQGRKEEAIAAFRIVALELDLREGYLELAKLLPRGSPERETYLLKTAQAGNFEACHLLALDLADRANEPGLSQAEREEAAYMAQEWAWQVPNVGEGKGLLSTIAEKVKDIVRLRSDFAPYVDGHGESPVSIR